LREALRVRRKRKGRRKCLLRWRDKEKAVEITPSKDGRCFFEKEGML